jgi:hypothetical protein
LPFFFADIVFVFAAFFVDPLFVPYFFFCSFGVAAEATPSLSSSPASSSFSPS